MSRKPAIRTHMLKHIVHAAYEAALAEEREWTADAATSRLMEAVYETINGSRVTVKGKRLIKELVEWYAEALVDGRII